MKDIPLKDFFRNPEKTQYKIAPNGHHISFLAPYETRLNIYIQDRFSAEIRRITSEIQQDISFYFWKSDSTLLYLLDSGGDENYHLFSVHLDSADVHNLTPFEGVRVNIVDSLDAQPDELLLAMNQRVPEIFDVYRLHIPTGALQMIYQNPGNVTNWLADHTGALRFAESTDGVNTTLLYRETEEEEFRPVFTSDYKESIVPFCFSFDNTRIYASSNLNRDRMTLIEFNPVTGREDKILFEHPEVDIDDLTYSRKRKVLTTVSYITWKHEREFFDAETRIIFEDLEQQLSGKEIILADMTLEEDIFIIRTFSDRSLGAYYLYGAREKTLTKLADISPWLKEEDLAETKPITYIARDGLTIHGYLTLPKNHLPGHTPIVVNVHGGPWARDTWGFNPEVQFLANKGYGVLQVNYRGSTGYGRRFNEAGFRQWGRGTMQHDISDGVHWLIEERIAHPDRIAIYGASYGGYATLAGLAFTPELYACGIDYVGVSNLFTFMETIPPYWEPFLEMMYEMVGHPEHDREMFESISPLFHVANIRAPLFVAQGANDPRVKKSESDQIVQALRSRGIHVPYMVKENEGHGFHNEENRFEFYEAMEHFLAEHLGVKRS